VLTLNVVFLERTSCFRALRQNPARTGLAKIWRIIEVAVPGSKPVENLKQPVEKPGPITGVKSNRLEV
jgi:hypothetical protein